MKQILAIIFLVSVTGFAHGQSMYPDSMEIGSRYHFEIFKDSLSQLVAIEPIGKSRIKYYINVAKGNSGVTQLTGIAVESLRYISSEKNIWSYATEDGSYTITVYGNDASEIEIYTRPVIGNRMKRKVWTADHDGSDF